MRSSFNLMIVIVLICSIVCSSVNSNRVQGPLQKDVCLKNPNSHNVPATPLPAKVESEKDFKNENNFFFIQQVSSFIPLNSPELKGYSHFDPFRCRGNITGVPIYVSKRSFLI